MAASRSVCVPGNCTYEGTLSFTPLNFGYKGGTASLIIDTEVIARNAGPAGCPWSVGLTGSSIGNIAPSTGYGPAIGASAPTITVFTKHSAEWEHDGPHEVM